MSFLDTIARAKAYLERQGRVSLRALRREFALDDVALDELVEELVDVQQVAVREGAVLVLKHPEVQGAGGYGVRGSESDRSTAGLAAPHLASETRKVVSIVFADLAGSTALQERLDPESARSFMERYYRAMRSAVEAHGGTVVKLLGDGVMAAFGVPRVAEDDAIRAVRAAVAMQNAFRALASEQRDIGLRVAVNSGEVMVSGDDSDVVGDPVNVAARLQQEAQDGDVVIGEATRRLVAARMTLDPLGSFALKGRTETVKAYRVVSLDRPTGATTAAFVGRDEELARITAVYDAAVAMPAARLAVLLGSPGLGKSRLIDEVGRRLGDSAIVVTAQCDATGGATFAPVAAALREFLNATRGQVPLRGNEGESLRTAITAVLPDDIDGTRVADGIAALLAGSPASPEETFFVIRRFLTGLAANKPVVLVLDDLHWAEPLLLDLVEHLIQWGSRVPLLVLVGARPELRDQRSSLVTPGGLVADVITLSGLDAGAAMRLAANVIGAADLPSTVAAKVLATSEGNPLFVGELVRMLVDEGAIERQGDRWIVGANLAALEMPPTIHALLAARIERLRSEERTVLEYASVVGRHFSRGAVAALLAHDGNALDARLEALRRTELIEPDTGWFLGEPVLRFHHVLIRDAAYRRLLKGTRAELHARLADWIEAKVGNVDEHDETIGWHLEQAHQHLRELGPLDDRGKGLGARASQRLAAAGRRALSGDDIGLAAGLLGRALDRLDADDAARADLALDWCEALLSAGDVGPAAKAIDELSRLIASNLTTNNASSRLRAWHTCFAGQLTVLTAPQELQATADAVAAAALELGKLDDAAGEAKAHSVHAQALARLGKVGACEAALDKALAAARKAGDRRRANAVLAGAPLAALWGPSPVTRASGRCLDVVRVLRITQGAPAVESVALSCQGVLEALRGRTEAARRMIASSRRMVEELGIAHRLFEADVFAGRIDLLEGDAAAAERKLRGAHDGLRDLGLGIDAARAGALLARAQLAQGKVADAARASQASEALAGDDLQAAIAWRGVRAEALAKRGEHGAAVELAQAAVAIASATDALLDHADARMALAAALRAAGRGTEADAEQRRAIELWEAKGATLLAERPGTERAAHTGSLPLKNGGQEGFADASSKQIPLDPLFSKEEAESRRRVRPNAATAMNVRFLAALAARDFDALAAEFHEQHREIDHPTGSTYGRDAAIASVQRLFRSRDPHYEVEPIATLGERLLLFRRRTRASGDTRGRYDVGPYENEAFQLFEVDASGLCRNAEVFAVDHLGDAVTRLYERYAELLPEGAERARAAATARSVQVVAPGSIDLDGYTEVFRSDVAIVDHRVLGLGSSIGPQMLFRSMAAAREVGDQLMSRPQDVLALTHDALLLRWLASGVGRESGGAFEWAFLRLFIFDPDGRVARYELFDAEREGEAVARFEKLARAAAATPNEPFANAASRTDAELLRCFNARDWEGVLACVAPVMVFDERRRMLHNTCGRDIWLEQFRVAYDVPASRFTTTLRATRDERLALSLHGFTGEVAGGGGPLAIDDHLALHEVDRDGRIVAIVLFDLEDEEVAYAELDARFEAGEGLAYAAHMGLLRAFGRATASQEWDPLVALCAPTFVEHDHCRVATLGTTKGAAAWARNFSTLVDLATDTAYRIDHVRSTGHGLWVVGTWCGTREGGPYEIPITAVLEFDDDGRLARADRYDDDQVDQARARFDELIAKGLSLPGGEGAETHFANAATRAVDRGTAALAARDWEGFACLFAPGARHYDRSRMVQLESDIQTWLASFRQMVEMTSGPPQRKLLATRGERLALFRMIWHGAQGDIGPSEIDWLLIIEVDDHGDHSAVVVYDPIDLDAAYAELHARWTAGEALAYPLASKWLGDYLRFFAARDWDAMTAIVATDFVGENHRLVGWGTLHGPAAVVSIFQAQIGLAPDTEERMDHVRTCDRGVLFEYAWHGTHEGGAFENLWIVGIELDDAGRARRGDVWEPEQIEQALARFEALRKPNPLAPCPAREGGKLAPLSVTARGRGRGSSAALVKPTTATAAMQRAWAAFDAGDLDAARALCTPNFIWEDRRPLVGLSGDVELMIASARERLATGARHERREIIGTAGDRVAIGRVLWAGGPTDGRFEVEFLVVHEVDAAGRCTAMIFLDPDDEGAAQREAWARWARIEPVAALWVELLTEFVNAWNARDLSWLRDRAADDLVIEDHRHAGLGRIKGADAYGGSLVALWALAPDQRLEIGWSWPAVDRHGFVVTARRVGTLASGGAFESEYLWLGVGSAGRVTRSEFFEIDELDSALARFEELKPSVSPLAKGRTEEGSLRIPPNAATQAVDRLIALAQAGDWGGARTLCAPIVFDDRRPLFRTTGDCEQFVTNTRFIWEAGMRPTRTVLATAGDRIELHRMLWSMGDRGALSEVETLEVFEVDAAGRICAAIIFDPGDRAAAEGEMTLRYMRERRPTFARQMEQRRDAGRDLARHRQLTRDDFVFHDRRRTGLGRLEGADAYHASLTALFELSPDAVVGFPLYYLADEPHGTLTVAHSFGTLTQGGAFESVYVMIMLFDRDGSSVVAELFELEDIDAARARFEDLRALAGAS
ncbi:MAG TPA: nuclear transport factor 2 family protein [Candidatus Binatia bacterium]|nr:nuclear transport factor 2 family protein [Candidatus Binatia bacterium]